MSVNQDTTSTNISKEDSLYNKNDEQGKNILYSDKNDWNEEKDNLFWEEIRKLPPEENDFFFFENIIFPSPLLNVKKYSTNPIGFFTKDYILKEHYLFWEKGQKKDFGGVVQFTIGRIKI